MATPSTPKTILQTKAGASTPSANRISYRDLNPSQYEAVSAGKGPLLVIAGAGSGKTRTLTYRVARLVEEGVPPANILLLSFTRKASQEMLRRASDLLDNRCQQVAGGTFHSFANSVLRRYAGVIGFDNGFSIIDRGDSEDLIGMIRKEIAAPDDRQLPRKSTLATILSRAINKSLPLEDIVYEDYPHFSHQIDRIDRIKRLYAERKRENHFMDYDDLLVYLHQLLSDHENIRIRLSSQYEFILVDEYQDTNLIQADIISLLAGTHRNVMVVGDDAQSIYAFRGANFKNILDFPQRFPGAQIIKLEENYRSLQPILDFTNELIASASEKYSKCLFTQRGGGRVPVLVTAASENAQSHYVANEILRLKNQGLALSRIAVLFRASFHAFDLELELNRAALPFKKVGGFKFTESAHIKDLLAHLKIVAAPRDEISWHRVLQLIEKIGPQTAHRIYEAVILEGGGAMGLLTAPLKIKNKTALDPLKEMIAAMEASPSSVARWGELALAYYLPYLQAQYDDHPRRLRDLEQLLAIMERYQQLDDFLSDMVLEPPNTAVNDNLVDTARVKESLTLSTIHSAKGLEWDTVFIIWALEGRFPSMRSMDNPADLEEERRLMYVAATRAQRDLHIVYPVQIYDRTTQSLLCEPSRFLETIGEAVLERRYFNPRNR
jgi:DNA helicase II / ATP-dependent DNA helicase PcrA